MRTNTRSDRYRLRPRRKPASYFKARPTKKKIDDLPEEIILKIGELLPDVDLISYSHANLRTFKVFSKASLIWKRRLDPEDRKTVKTANANATFSCPEKEMFFSRTKSERNWRKSNFKVLGDHTIHEIFTDSYAHYCDFYIYGWNDYSLQHLNVIWVDLNNERGFQNGVLRRKRQNRGHLGVFAASKSIMIVFQSFDESTPHRHSLFAVDLTQPDHLRVRWEQDTVDNLKCHVNVANFKIYKMETNPENSTVISILSPDTGQTLSTWSNDPFGTVINSVSKLS